MRLTYLSIPVFLLLMYGLPLSLHATHIVGGEMNYTCLGNDEYEITLTIFRDCFNGNPQAWFDDPASIGIFNSNNELLQDIRIDLMGNDTLNPVLTSECLVVPPDVCVHTTTYRVVVELPPIPGGYQLAYQRCCRNQTIVNIVDPLDTGATYGVTISEKALEECNSSPKFKDWPPIYICVNEPIVFDQSAIDQDGDSIVYRLCTPLTGATPDFPQPQPPNNPPYDEITWVAPTYGVDNMLNGSPGGAPLQINSQTGLLTGLPNTIGQFVVGICAEEYRNGELISTTRRDFQYNVGLCGQTVAAFAAPELQCGSLSVSFDNQSDNAESFLWQFNDPGNPGATSSFSDPVFTFSDTGSYTILLIANPGTICADTAFQEVRLQPESLFPDFDFTFGECDETLEVQFTDLSTDTISDIISWNWEVMPGDFSSSESSPAFSFTESGSYQVQLTVTSASGCEASVVKTVQAELIDDVITEDSLAVCLGDSAALNPVPNLNYNYQWAPSADIIDLEAANPVVAPTQTTTYDVVISDAEGVCSVERSILVFVPQAITAEAPPDTVTCDAELLLQGNSNTGVDFQWSLDPSFGNLIGEEAAVTVALIGEETYYFLAQDEYGCTAIDSVSILSQAVNVQLASNLAICPGNFGRVAAVNLDDTDTLTYNWVPDSLLAFGDGSETAFFDFPAPGNYDIFVEITNQFGCSLLDSTQLTLIDTLPQDGFQMAQQCGGYTVDFSTSSVNAPFMIWRFGDPDAPFAVQQGGTVSHTYSGPGTYQVQITYSPFIPCPDTVLLEVVVEEPAIIPGFEYEIVGCSDSLLIQFQDTSINTQSDIIEWEWSFSNGQTDSVPNPTLVLTESEVIGVTLSITSSDGCVDELGQEIVFELPTLVFPDSLVACPGELLSLNPSPEAGYTYTWSPEALFGDPNVPNPTIVLEEGQVFTVVAEQEDGPCIFTDTVVAEIAPPFDYTLTPDTLLCDGDLELQVQSNAELDYLWASDPVFSAPLGGSASLTVEAAGSQTYYVQLTDIFGCSQRDSVIVQGSNILIFADPQVGVCESDTVRLEVINLLEDQMLFYDWAPDANILEGQGTSSVLVQPTSNQTFTVMVMDELGCSVTESIQVTIEQSIPPLSATAAQDTLYEAGSVQLFATQDDGYEYIWSPAALLNNPFSSNPIATIDTTTTFRVVVTDENGCTNEALLTLTFLSECLPPYIFVPNAFTPNGDNLNDLLEVKGNTIDELYFAIYDRWGELVFETTDQSIGWDGSFRGRDLSPDVYGYYLEARCFNGETYTQKGNITLIR
jgi:gliding motility-associated-like protein